MSEDALQLLREMRDGIRELVAIAKQRQQRAAAPTVPYIVATDRDLDDPKYGNPVVRNAPRDWTGRFSPGQRMSECDPELLDLVAARCEHYAAKNDAANVKTDAGVPKSKYDRLTAARARGWAKRLRAGYEPAGPTLMDEAGWRDGEEEFT